MPTASEIRRQFLDYFVSQGHRLVASSPLVPKDDPTLMFTNAGMVQFKAPLLGLEKRDYVRATTSQKCFRASGKHNDLENVGFTGRHHTFFEMLGNFSFGNYFKEGAIAYCWELITQRYGLDPGKLWVTVHHTDDQAERIWIDRIGVSPDRVVRLGDKDNFWAMGDTGPCGPCSEVYVDQGPSVSCPDPAHCGVECDCDRYLEIWNLVFMQYNRDDKGQLSPLPAPSIDTGMGLERISAVLQGVFSNYETDLFTPIMDRVGDMTGLKYKGDTHQDVSFRVIADHSRAVSFLISDGVLPSNEGRGYVLRRVLRRAVRHGRVLGLTRPFLTDLVEVVGRIMQDQYPEILQNKAFIRKIVEGEESRFADTLDAGLRLLSDSVENLRARGTKVLSGEEAFKLYDTYGFPLDLITDVLRDEGLSLDQAGFEAAMDRQRTLSRASWKGSGEKAATGVAAELLAQGVTTEFVGYHSVKAQSRVAALIKDGLRVKTIQPGDKAEVVTALTPFYAAAGGQVGDTGWIEAGSLDARTFESRVLETVKYDNRLWVHHVEVTKGQIAEGDLVDLRVHPELRSDIQSNHTATHLLHTSLRTVLGEHVKQAGSYVGPDRLRFDFTHFSPLTHEELLAVEGWVNYVIREDVPVATAEMAMNEALAKGAIALFEERYGERVRLVEVKGVSKELCGGIHVPTTGRIGVFKILSDESVGSGLRRIEALTGREALRYFQAAEAERFDLGNLLKAKPGDLVVRVSKVLEQLKAKDKEIEALKAKLAQQAAGDLLAGLKEVAGVPVLSRRVEAADPRELRTMADRIREKLASGVVLLGASDGDKAFLLALVTPDLQKRFPAGTVVKTAAQVLGGKGGGRPDLAQAGGPQADKLPQALETVYRLVGGQE